MESLMKRQCSLWITLLHIYVSLLCVQMVLGFNDLIILDAPNKALPSQRLDVFYTCSKPATVQLDLIVLFDTGRSRLFYLTEWECDPYGNTIKIVELNLPDWLVYQADGIVPDSPWVLSCTLEVALMYPTFDGTEEIVAVEDVAMLEPVPYYERPLKQHQLSIAWSLQMLRLTRHFLKKQCVFEQEEHLMSTIFASTGEIYGIFKTVEPFRNKALEYLRLTTFSFPRFTVSMWILLTRHCQGRMCGLFYHINSDENYATPTLFLTKSGQLHVQMKGELNKPFAFLSQFKVPLNKWCQISVMVDLARVTVSMVCVDEEQKFGYSTDYISSENIALDDTEGYFGIGGCSYIRGAEGFYGPLVYHRNTVLHQSMSEVVLPDVVKAVNVHGWIKSCKAFRLEMSERIRRYSLQANQGRQFDTCIDAFYEFVIKDRLTSQPQCELWEETSPHRRQAVKLAKHLAYKNGDRGVKLAALGRALYSYSLHELGRTGKPGVVSRILPLLLQAGCLADNRALHMASVLYISGLEVKTQPEKAWRLALLAAQKDDISALIHLAQRHLYHQDLHGFPEDKTLAYMYYEKIAEQKNLGRFYITPEQMVLSLNEVTLLNPPRKALPRHTLYVYYFCEDRATVQLDLLVSFDTGITNIVPLREWTCKPHDPKIKRVRLNLPDWLVYQADGIVPDTQRVLSCTLEAAITYPALYETEEVVAASNLADLEPVPYFERPVKKHQLCIAWSLQMLRLTQHFSKKQCPFEHETVHLLSSVFASTGETFGITNTLGPFNQSFLENLRTETISDRRCLLTLWVFVTRHCNLSLCGLFYHIDSEDKYISPTLFLTDTGHLHVQMSAGSEDSAFLSTFTVPLNEWCQISLKILSKTVVVSMLCADKRQRADHASVYTFSHDVTLDDTEGYFVIGGCKFMRGIEGYFGPVIFHRNRFPPEPPSVVSVPDVVRSINLTGWLHSCEAFSLDISEKIREYSLQAKLRAQSSSTHISPPGTCLNSFYKWLMKIREPAEPLEPQCELWEETAPHRRQAADLVKLLTLKRGDKGVSQAALGRALYSLSLHKLSRRGRPGAVSRIIPLLLQASCLADKRALHMASVLYSSGLGVKTQPYKSWLLALLGAQKDDRFSLMHLGYMHHMGVHGLPADQALALAYYANIGKQSAEDHLNPTPDQIYAEQVYLNNEEVLSQQTAKDHHIFQWLKLQAERGAADAEQRIARMLFWGQQGVAPNIQEAVRHYERGAVQLEDPVLMYDYAIVLLKGQGVEKDVPKAVTFLKKAMDKGFAPAVNAMGWYYEQFENDYEQAVKLWEQADELGSHEAAMNLGIIHSQGRYPGRPADHFLAYQYYLRAGKRGSIRGGVLMAEYLITGISGHLNRHEADALSWMKWATDYNGYLGMVIRQAMDAYLKKDMFTSLLYYTMAAECGHAIAQFNVAYLCEQNPFGILDPALASRCMWRYYNLTALSQFPDPYALVKMGDLFYEGNADVRKDLLSAAVMYSQAANSKEPQGWYNLGLLAAEGCRLPLSVLDKLGLSDLFLEDSISLQSALYKRCRDLEKSDGFLPCSLALYNVYFQSFQKHYNTAIKVSTAVAVLTASTMFLIFRVVLRRTTPSIN